VDVRPELDKLAEHGYLVKDDRVIMAPVGHLVPWSKYNQHGYCRTFLNCHSLFLSSCRTFSLSQ